MGTYVVVVSDGIGCPGRDTVEITEPLPYDISSSQDSVSCNNSNDGIASVIVSGGTPKLYFIYGMTQLHRQLIQQLI